MLLPLAEAAAINKQTNKSQSCADNVGDIISHGWGINQDVLTLESNTRVKSLFKPVHFSHFARQGSKDCISKMS